MTQSLLLRNLQSYERDKDKYINNFNKMYQHWGRVLRSSQSRYLLDFFGNEKALERKSHLN